MQTWKRALLAGSAGAAVVMFVKGKPTAGALLAGVSLAALASEYPEKFEDLCDRLPEYVERGTSYLDAASRLGARLAEMAERRGSAWLEGLLEG